MLDGRKLTLKTGDLRFNKLDFDRKARAAVLTWYADTEVSNISFVKVVVLKLGWPPVKIKTCFTNAQ